jgi:translocator protein
VTLTIVVAVLAASVVAGAGAALTDVGPWYYALRKPTWQPPDWLFGPAWTVILGLAALSGVLAWENARDADSRAEVIGLFAVNGVLHVAWSLLFFRLRRPDWALIEVVPPWLSILVLILALAPLSRTASWALLPYLLWVAFAAVLNLAIVRLNAPFKRA